VPSPIVDLMEGDPPRCASCGLAIGMYEPIAVVEGGSMRITSLAREPQLAADTTGLMHHSCASDGEATAGPRGLE
jgi:hypothetical protein